VATPPHDAVLVVSFGAPESREEVIPFLENVMRGRRVPPERPAGRPHSVSSGSAARRSGEETVTASFPQERLREVAEHYYHFGGRSPLNDQVRALIGALEVELAADGIHLPLYWGNRNWHPLLADTMRRMKADGIRRALALVTSAWSSYSSCRQYLENLEAAREAAGPEAPRVDKIRPYWERAGFLEAQSIQVREALDRIPPERRAGALLVYTAHSIPLSMAAGCRYASELDQAAGRISAMLGHRRWRLVYQSRSGPPGEPWLGPDISDALREIAVSREAGDVVVTPLGFLSDHMEVCYDLDVVARGVADGLGLNFVRASTVGAHPRFVTAIRESIGERLRAGPMEEDRCPQDCCPAPRR